MATIEISRKAENDLYSIWEWGVERYGLDSADEFINDLNTTFKKIADIPYGYTARPDLTETMRSKNHKRAYIIFTSRLIKVYGLFASYAEAETSSASFLIAGSNRQIWLTFL